MILQCTLMIVHFLISLTVSEQNNSLSESDNKNDDHKNADTRTQLNKKLECARQQRTFTSL
jgi:hypothetical protein